MDKNAYFKLHEGCFLINGAKNGAIYNLLDNEVYSLDGKVTKILKNVSKVQSILEEAKKVNIQEKEIKKYLRELLKLGVAFLRENDIHIQKMKSSFAHKQDYFQEKAKLTSITCELTTNCNLNCLHCSSNKPTILNCYCNRYHNEGSTLSTGEWKKILINASILGCNSVKFIGGEPFLFTDINQILDFCIKLKLKKISLFTNGTLINASHINILKKSNATLIIPIYSHVPSIHDKISGKKGSFKKLIGNISKLKKNMINVNICLLLNTANYGTSEKTKRFIKKELGLEFTIDLIPPFNFNEMKANKNNHLNFKYKTYPIFNKTDLDSFSIRKKGNSCWIYQAAIKSNGDVIPCIKARNMIIGNIKNNTLYEMIINGSFDKYWFLSKDKIKTCKSCEFRYACDDCRLIAFKYGKNLYQRYPLCSYDPYNGNWENNFVKAIST